MAEIGPEIERLVALAAQLDGLDEIALKLAALKRERSALSGALRAAELGKAEPEKLRAEITASVDDLGSSLAAERERGQAGAPGALAG